MTSWVNGGGGGGRGRLNTYRKNGITEALIFPPVKRKMSMRILEGVFSAQKTLRGTKMARLSRNDTRSLITMLDTVVSPPNQSK